MIVEIVAYFGIFAMGFFIGFGSFYYGHSRKESKVTNSEETDKSLLSLSQSKIIEVPARKEKSPLYVFKNGKKQEFVMNSNQNFEIKNK